MWDPTMAACKSARFQTGGAPRYKSSATCAGVSFKAWAGMATLCATALPTLCWLSANMFPFECFDVKPQNCALNFFDARIRTPRPQNCAQMLCGEYAISIPECHRFKLCAMQSNARTPAHPCSQVCLNLFFHAPQSRRGTG